MKKKIYFMGPLAVVGLLAFSTAASAAHPDVTMRNPGGGAIDGGTTNMAYSPKKTCGYDDGLGSCHGSAVYEDDIQTAVKTDVDGVSTIVPYPAHGVTAGFHFQQGNNHDWSDVQRHFYHLPDFTSSGGMIGKY